MTDETILLNDARFRKATVDKFMRAIALKQLAKITDTAAISAIFTDTVKAEEAAEPTGILATIHAIYDEFKPETMKGFDVNIGGSTARFEHLNDAEFYARCNADRVARASSVDHYLFDKSFGAANAEAAKPTDAATIDTAAISDIFSEAVKAEEAGKDTKPIKKVATFTMSSRTGGLLNEEELRRSAERMKIIRANHFKNIGKEPIARCYHKDGFIFIFREKFVKTGYPLRRHQASFDQQTGKITWHKCRPHPWFYFSDFQSVPVFDDTLSELSAWFQADHAKA